MLNVPVDYQEFCATFDDSTCFCITDAWTEKLSETLLAYRQAGGKLYQPRWSSKPGRRVSWDRHALSNLVHCAARGDDALLKIWPEVLAWSQHGLTEWSPIERNEIRSQALLRLEVEAHWYQDVIVSETLRYNEAQRVLAIAKDFGWSPEDQRHSKLLQKAWAEFRASHPLGPVLGAEEDQTILQGVASVLNPARSRVRPRL